MSARAKINSAQAERASARLPGTPKNPCSEMLRRTRSLTDTGVRVFGLLNSMVLWSPLYSDHQWSILQVIAGACAADRRGYVDCPTVWVPDAVEQFNESVQEPFA